MQEEEYTSAVQLASEAAKLPESPTKQKLLHAVILILRKVVNEGELAVPQRWDAQMLLVQTLIEHTTLLDEAAATLRGLKLEQITPEYECKSKLLQIDLEIALNDTQRALVLSDELLELVEKVDAPGLQNAFLLQRFKLGPLSQTLLDKIEDANVCALFDVLMHHVGARHEITNPDVLVLDVLERFLNALRHGIVESDIQLVEELRGVDWSRLWRNGRAKFATGSELIQVSVDTKNDMIITLLYVVLTIFHFAIDEGDCSVTKSWLSELLQHVSSTPIARDVLGVIYFYAVLVYHMCNKASSRDILLDQMAHLNADVDLVDYCRGVIAQQAGDFEEAIRCYDRVVSQNSALKVHALLNLVAMAPNSVSYTSRLTSLKPEEPQLTTLQLIKALTKPDSMSAAEHRAVLQSLATAEFTSPVERALALLIQPGEAEIRAENYEQAIVAFDSMGLESWKEFGLELQRQVI